MISTVLTLLFIGFLAWMFFKEKVEPALQIISDDIEGQFIELKKKILQTDPSVNQSKYEHLYKMAGNVLAKILDRHNHYILDWDASHNASDLAQYLVSVTHHNAQGAYRQYALPRNSNLDSIPHDTLFFICIMMYLGGTVKNYGNIEEDYHMLSKAIGYLADEVNYPPAVFLKGFMFKYGLQIFTKPNSQKAQEYLSRAEKLGVGAALLELNSIHRYDVLSKMSSVHDSLSQFDAKL